jgi:hypothetical protein
MRLKADRGPLPRSGRRAAEVQGLQAFVASGWADQALLLGWTPIELYRVSFVWFRVDLTGAALLIGADPSAQGRAQLDIPGRPTSKTASRLINRYILQSLPYPKIIHLTYRYNYDIIKLWESMGALTAPHTPS